MNESDVKRSVSAQEWQARVDLAAAYRLTALFGWDDLVYTHISMRIPGTHAFLLNPYGMMFDEITASSLVKIDLDGNKLAPSEYDINPAGFTIHSAVHAAREDVACVMHTHSLNGVAVSAQADGLLPISQQALLVMRSLACHDYEGIAVEPDEKPRLVRDLGERNVMLLRNHGLLTVGASAAAAFVGMYFAEAACAIQVRAQAGGGALRMIPQPILDGIARQSRITTRDMGPEQLVWPGLLRRLDRRNPGYAS
ncbi:class II aldolase/adducin family protein [Burkholderia multivorans]|uniref:Class II aldolase/adducin family protein n=1 Tax=Burkholderia multivorans CGD2 TaxID=513052 RepID=B9BN96_9BURK|nr:class II aldolase/adducin family protein [Burkholderia multivorans]EEE08106.1 class II aldolase/adducin family protein [Burkholderia multivorans CGD2]EEE10544.1 class II aldolase/adducin family protein [Burkholderia multivorans CGD2M]